MRRTALLTAGVLTAGMLLVTPPAFAERDRELEEALVTSFHEAVQEGDDPFSALIRAMSVQGDFELPRESVEALADRFGLPPDSEHRELLEGFVSLKREGDWITIESDAKRTLTMGEGDEEKTAKVGREVRMRVRRLDDGRVRVDKVDGMKVSNGGPWASIDWAELSRDEDGPKMEGEASFLFFSKDFDADLSEPAEAFREWLAEQEEEGTLSFPSGATEPGELPDGSAAADSSAADPEGSAPADSAATEPSDTPGVVGVVERETGEQDGDEGD